MIVASNPLLRIANKGSFDPRPDEASRVVASQAVVAAMGYSTPLEFTVSAAKGEAPPTAEEWEGLLAGLA